MSKSVQLKVNDNLIKTGKKLAKQYGFSSYEDLIAFWTEQAKKGNLHISSQSPIEYLTDEEAKVVLELDREFHEAEKRGEVYTANSINDFLAQLYSDE